MTIKGGNSEESDTVRVIFQLSTSVWAESVYLVGDFNNWSIDAHRLSRSLDGEWWQIAVDLQKGRTYQYRYLLDRTRWCNDWQADRYVPNMFGGDNSVLDT